MLKHPHHHFSIPVFFSIIALIVGALMLVWSQMPAPQARFGWLSWLPSATPSSGLSIVQPLSVTTTAPPPTKSDSKLPATSYKLPARVIPPGMICGEGNLICVGSQYQNILFSNPIVVTGTARVFENQFSWSLFDAQGHALEKGNVMAKAPDPDADQASTFEIRSFFSSVPSSSTGSLMLFEFSPRDGEIVNKLIIPVRLPTKTMNVTIWVPNDWQAWSKAINNHENGDGPAPNPIQWLQPQSRVAVETRAPMQATLANLLQWLKKITQKNDELEIKNFLFKKGVAYVELGMDQNGWAGVSYDRAMIDPLIEMTLLKFSGVKKVVRGPLPVK